MRKRLRTASSIPDSVSKYDFVLLIDVWDWSICPIKVVDAEVKITVAIAEITITASNAEPGLVLLFIVSFLSVVDSKVEIDLVNTARDGSRI